MKLNIPPNPLPVELSIGTKILEDGVIYTAGSIGTLNTDNKFSSSYYNFTKLFNDTGTNVGGCSFFIDQILWNESPLVILEKEISINLIINCKWCKKVIDNGMLICSSHESNCEKYWDALKERCNISYLNPNNASDYDRTCVKNFVDNKKEI